MREKMTPSEARRYLLGDSVKARKALDVLLVEARAKERAKVLDELASARERPS